MHETVTIRLENNAMLDAPVYEGHKRGRNWCAVIAKDPKAPGGLDRRFLPVGRGDYYYILSDAVTIGAPLEFGADYYSGGGKVYRLRWYGVVSAVSDGVLTLTRYESAADAIRMGRAMADPGQVERRIALEMEAAGLRQRLAAIEDELATLPILAEIEVAHG